MKYQVLAGVAAAVIVTGVSYSFNMDRVSAPFNPWEDVVDQKGGIQVPDVDFRKDWSALGTWVLSEEDEGVTEQHVVYAQPDAVSVYRETGEFPDGAVLVKELFQTQSDYLTTGHASWPTDVTGWFVMVKDKKGRFSENDLWGDGWGWAYFDAADRDNPTTTNYVLECVPCHTPAKETDWLFVQGYPSLKGK